DHEEAVRHEIAARYLLDQLDPAQRDAFEEHYFDCRLCADEVQAGSTFLDAARPEVIAPVLPAPGAALGPPPALPRPAGPGPGRAGVVRRALGAGRGRGPGRLPGPGAHPAPAGRGERPLLGAGRALAFPERLARGAAGGGGAGGGAPAGPDPLPELVPPLSEVPLHAA